MPKTGVVAAEFAMLSDANGAVDWFRNQAVHAGALEICAVAPNAQPRLPQRGDNQRPELRWIVAIDVDRAPVSRRDALDTLLREGGKLLAHYAFHRANDAPTEERAVTQAL